MYTTKHAQILYRLASSQTIRNWSKEFEEYLSPSATPEKGYTRHFTIDDMKVFSLIAEYSNMNRSFADIHVALKAGQRGEAPRVVPEDLDSLVAGEIETQLNTELQETRDLAERLQNELEMMKAQYQPVKEENIRLEARIEDRENQLAYLRQQLQDAQNRITQLAEEKGNAYVRGIMDGLKQQGNLGKNDTNES